jgi:ribose transport system permease protein
LFILSGVGLAVLSEPATGSTPWLDALGGQIGGFFPGALILIAVPFAVWWLLGRTPFIQALYSVGGDELAAYSAGIDVRRVRVIAYMLGGAFAGLAGIALAAATQSADASQATQYTLPAIAAVAIGGTSFAGGRGGPLGSLAGAAIMFLSQTLLDAIGVSGNWDQVIYGVMLLGAILGSSALGMSGSGLHSVGEEGA